jgi:aryl-alcohol dehydrogenase-like predicted oxidoreductase
MEAMEILLKAGKIRAAGVCNYNLEDMKTANTFIKLASNQVPYSMLRRDIEKDIVPWCIEHNVSILPYSPLQRGLLTGKFKKGHHFNPGDTRKDAPYYKDSNIRRTNEFLEKLRPLAHDKKATLTQLVLRWTMQMPGITTVLAGARNPEQVAENAGALNFSLSEQEMQQIQSYIENLDLDL